MNRHRAFQMLAACAAAAAAYHALAALGVLHGDGAPRGRHAVFVAIGLMSCWYLLRRPAIALPLHVILTAQQTLSHGGRALRLWSLGIPDWVSILVLAALYAGLLLLVLDARDRWPRVRRVLTD